MKRMSLYIKVLVTCIGSIVFLLFSISAYGQISIDGDGPIHISAKKSIYQGNKIKLVGNVNVKQGQSQIFSDKMTIFRQSQTVSPEDTANLGAVTHIIAKGNFKYVSDTTTVTGDTGEYFRKTGKITVTGDVGVSQPNGSWIRGGLLVYDINSNTTQLNGNCYGTKCQNRVTFSSKQ